MNQIQRMLAQVGHLSTGVVPEPAEMINATIGVVRPVGGGSEHHLPIQACGWVLVGWVAKSGHGVAEKTALHRNDLADFALPPQLTGVGKLRAGAVLRAARNETF